MFDTFCVAYLFPPKLHFTKLMMKAIKSFVSRWTRTLPLNWWPRSQWLTWRPEWCPVMEVEEPWAIPKSISTWWVPALHTQMWLHDLTRSIPNPNTSFLLVLLCHGGYVLFVHQQIMLWLMLKLSFWWNVAQVPFALLIFFKWFSEIQSSEEMFGHMNLLIQAVLFFVISEDGK